MRISDWSSDVCSSDQVHWAVLPQEMESIRRKHHGRVRSAITQKASRVRKGRKRRKGEANADNFSDRPSRRHPSESWGPCCCLQWIPAFARSEEHTSELQSLMRTSYAVFCLK